jgi:hypothetical protein
MIVLAFAIVGGLLGAITARRRQGNRLDILQYATVYAIAFALLGMIVTIVVSRIL